MKPKKYKAKSISGAERYVRNLLRQKAELAALLEIYAHHRKMLAMLAADGPAFFDPLTAMEAKNIRNECLKKMNLNTDGSQISP